MNWVSQLVEVTFEIDSDLKEQAEKVCAEYGLTLEEATILFFKETVRLGKLPFASFATWFRRHHARTACSDTPHSAAISLIVFMQ